jgi:hypothetical protein
MRFRYSTTDPTQHESDSLPWLPVVLRVGARAVEAVGLVDSGATVNVLPYELGVELGAEWDDRKAILQVSGSLGRQPAPVASSYPRGIPTRLSTNHFQSACAIDGSASRLFRRVASPSRFLSTNGHNQGPIHRQCSDRGSACRA